MDELRYGSARIERAMSNCQTNSPSASPLNTSIDGDSISSHKERLTYGAHFQQCGSRAADSNVELEASCDPPICQGFISGRHTN